jgi:hypothetical protein
MGLTKWWTDARGSSIFRSTPLGWVQEGRKKGIREERDEKSLSVGM